MKTNPNPQTSFLVGNGINKVSKNQGQSWKDLLKQLADDLSAGHVDLDNKFKPFPLALEEILFSLEGDYDENTKRVKNKIAEVFASATPNAFHHKIVNCGIKNVLTTNYDYSFEKAIVRGFDNTQATLPYATLETKHSVKRRCFFADHNVSNFSVWHIHGEINHNRNFRKGHYASESIQIGYDHYIEYLGEIRSYLAGTKYKDQSEMSEKLRNNISGTSWIDKFFTDRLVIFGLELDFSEIDIWWLLNYRFKLFRRKAGFKKNEIVYYQPAVLGEKPKNPQEELELINERNRNAAKESVLKSLGVAHSWIEAGSYEEFYGRILEREGIS